MVQKWLAENIHNHVKLCGKTNVIFDILLFGLSFKLLQTLKFDVNFNLNLKEPQIWKIQS